MKIDNPADLRVLIHTARAGTLTAAANALGITPARAVWMSTRRSAGLSIFI